MKLILRISMEDFEILPECNKMHNLTALGYKRLYMKTNNIAKDLKEKGFTM